MLEILLLALLIILLGVISVYVAAHFTRARAAKKRMLTMTFLKIKVPKKESKEDKEADAEMAGANRDFKDNIGFMRQFFDSLAALGSDKFERFFFGETFLSCELVVQDNLIDFYIVVPRALTAVIEKQLTSYFPDCFTEECSDYNIFEKGGHAEYCYLTLADEFYKPVRTYQHMNVDPLNNLTNVLSKLDPSEGAAVQIMLSPKANGWQAKGRQAAKDILADKSSKSFLSYLNPITWLKEFFELIFRGEAGGDSPDVGVGRTSSVVDEQVKTMEEKNTQMGFTSVIRLIASSPSKNQAAATLTAMKSAFAQYATTDNNAFTVKDKRLGDFVHNFLMRSMDTPFSVKEMVLVPEELSSLFHVPNIKYNRTPTINWQNYKIAKAPANIPKDGLLLGHNTFRGVSTPIYMKNDDRFRHFYVVGQTGTGKSSVLQVMIRQDMKNGKGVCVVDPHGQLIEDLLPFVPRSRADDVIYFNPADTERPMGLNLLEAKNPEQRDLIALEAMNIMIKLFDEEVFGPRIQDYFRNGCLTLMEYKDGGALTDIVRLFTDDAYQKERTKDLQNPVVKSFWENQMAKTGAREKQEMIPYFASKFGQFVTNGMMRNIIGQSKSAFDFNEVMDNNKLLFINLSKGATGDINSKLLGMIVVAKLQAAALARQSQTKEERQDFFLYIDEFQNYVTDSIEVILSEARKYRLSLNMAHQYLAQLETGGGSRKAGVNLKDAIFGNVGTIMAYKIGAQDAEYMAKEMAPVFSDQDLINVDKYKAVMKLSIDTQPSKPFSITPVNPYLETGDPEAAEAYKQLSRLKYGRDKEFIEREIFRRLGAVF